MSLFDNADTSQVVIVWNEDTSKHNIILLLWMEWKLFYDLEKRHVWFESVNLYIIILTFFIGMLGRIPRVKTAQEYFDLIFYYKNEAIDKK